MNATEFQFDSAGSHAGDAGRIGLVLSSPVWAWLASAGMVAAYISATPEHRYAGAIVSAVVYALVASLFPACRPVAKTPLCPWNWALFLFALQLLVLPFSVLLAGPSLGVLPRLPSDLAINLAMLLGGLSFLVFSATYQYLARRAPAAHQVRSAFTGDIHYQESSFPPRIVSFYIVLGIAGLLLAFGSPSGLLEYFEDPAKYVDQFAQASHTLSGFLSLVLRPFLGFALVMWWCGWIDRTSPQRTARRTALVTLIAIIGVILSYATFSYNRGAFVVPLISMLAVLLVRGKRVSIGALALAGGVLITVLLLAPFYAVYRNSGLTGNRTGSELLSDPEMTEFFEEKIDLVGTMQMYGAGPQSVGFLLEQTHWGARPYLGATLVPSLVQPVPILGRALSASSGPMIYNEMIYGTPEIFDQIFPFSSEMFLNFNVPGVLAGYCLLGIAAFWLQQKFERASTALEIYIWQYTAIWVLFLILGSISVVTQIFFYFFWPIYLLIAAKRIAKRRFTSQTQCEAQS